MLLLLLDLNIAQRNIPNSTAAPTHHVSISKNILFSPFSKIEIFKIFFGPFPEAPGAQAQHFRIPSSRYITSNFFPTFLLHFFTFLLKHSRRFDLLSLSFFRYSTRSLTSVQSPCWTEGPLLLLAMLAKCNSLNLYDKS